MKNQIKKLIIFIFVLTLFGVNVSAKEKVKQKNVFNQYLNSSQTIKASSDDVANLKEYITLAKKELEGDKTVESVKALKAGLKKAEAIIEDYSSYTKEEIMKTEDDLYKAIIYAETDYFKRIEQLIKSSQYTIEKVETYGLEIYTQESFTHLKDQLKEAEVFMSDTSMDQDDAKSLLPRLRYAYNNLDYTLNKQSLSQLEAEANELSEEVSALNKYEYTTETYQPLSEVVSELRDLISNENDDVHKYEVMLNATNLYLSNLEKLDFDELVSNTKAMSFDNYTSDSVKEVEKVLEEIKDLKAKKAEAAEEDEDAKAELSKKEEEKFYKELSEALSKLKLKDDLINDDDSVVGNDDVDKDDDIQDVDDDNAPNSETDDNKINININSVLYGLMIILGLGLITFLAYTWFKENQE